MLCDDLPAADDPMDDWLFLSHKSVEFLSDTTSLQETGDKGKLKSKLVSVWNSVKYGEFYYHDSKTHRACLHYKLMNF